MKRTALKRKESLRDSFARKLKENGTRTIYLERAKRGSFTAKRKPLKKQSRHQRNRLRKYYPISEAFLARPENLLCAICVALNKDSPAHIIRPATETHHARGRNSVLLYDERHFRPSCYWCRLVPHEHKAWARKHGLLCEAHLWNVPDRTLAPEAESV